VLINNVPINNVPINNVPINNVPINNVPINNVPINNQLNYFINKCFIFNKKVLIFVENLIN
jgi:hypothetical protein